MVLDCWFDNFFVEIEQVVFCLVNVLLGIDFSNDLLLQGCLFFYLDIQLLWFGGLNFYQILVNVLKCLFVNYYCDGYMQMQVFKGCVVYDFSLLQVDFLCEMFVGFCSYVSVDDGCKGCICVESFVDYYSQVCMFFCSLEKLEQVYLVLVLVFELFKVEMLKVWVCMVSYLCNIDELLVQCVVDGFVLLVLFDFVLIVMLVWDMFVVFEVCVIGCNKFILQGCCIGILFDEGFDVCVIVNLSKVVWKVGVDVKLVVLKVGGVMFSDGSVQVVDG